jgi:plasmid replication initiation protein
MANRIKLVVKDNALIEASYALDVVEQRIILLAILAARENQTTIKMGQLLAIHASQYMEVFNVERHAAYEALQNGVKGLYEADFTYTQIDQGITTVYKSRWVDKIGYTDKTATIQLSFASDVIPLISELENRFTQYDITQVASLKSRYAIRLYELLIQWRTTGKTPRIDLQELRGKLGVLDHEYKVMHAFKSRVLDKAISEINEHTDIKASYEQHKSGRIIVGFTFSFKQKSKPKTKAQDIERDPNTADLLANGFTDGQLARIAANAQFKADYNHMISPTNPANHSPSAWVSEMVKRLKTDPSQFNKRPLEFYLA